MDRILVLFFIGIASGVLAPIGEKIYQTSELLDDPLTAIEQAFASSARLWHLAISIFILVTLPAVVFKSIRNRLSKKAFLPIPYMTGISFGFTFMGTLGLIVSTLR